MSSDSLINTIQPQPELKRVAYWYFGGLASAGAACCTHPLDLLKVLLQTKGKTEGNLFVTTFKIIKEQGVLALYNGLSASLLRQLTYSTVRFGIYETAKKSLTQDGSKMPFLQAVSLAAVAGSVGGFVGSPADLVNVRMQNDIKLPLEERRNIYKIIRNEGFTKLFNGSLMATCRAMLVTIGQLSMYDQYKYLLLNNFSQYFDGDGLTTHFTASLLAGASATTITQPLDVMKTRLMNAAQGEYRSVPHCALSIFKEKGLFGFFTGYIPAFVRLAPHTILTFIFFEQLRLNFGYFQ
ncbi:hypothetical protein RND71_044006 [Anisodus tanguticus]|uniref:Mitochondrial dicarboxylate carrier n=1 Tax=Anisodus tanguticus TaxID=243964 RepID=A0AAE1UTU7_9SOLA|nr:hypothetical protein RND71_044006 [Anisodus tanguticus]